MDYRKHAIYSPYGASDLKASYQRNLLTAILSVVLGVALMVGAGWWLVPEPANGLVPVDRTNESDLQPLPGSVVITRPGPAVDWSPPPEVADEGTNWVPVPDDLLPESDETDVAADNSEWAIGESGIDYPSDLGDGDSGVTGGSGDGVEPLELFPGINDFVVCEQIAEMIYQSSPVYPRLAIRAGVEGTVYIKALVDKTGLVREAVVYKGSGNESLDQSAKLAAHSCRYRPAIQNGRPIALWVTYKVVFRLDE